MEEPRAESEAGGHMLPVSHRMPDRLQLLLVIFVHLDVSQKREVIAGLDPVQMRFEIRDKRFFKARTLGEFGGVLIVGEKLDPLVVEDWFFGREGAVLLVFAGQIARDDLARFDVRLIKSVNSDDRARYGGCDLPAEKLLTEIVSVLQRDANDRVTGLFQRGDFCIL